ncbi:MAG TPA: alpha/beta fold hydrolase [Candidatus Angelobacter sp.]|nr:alpha/beta fold hydrolase [Candidatus Angelobacter sp.]
MRATTDDGTHYRRSGSGAPVVLIHGVGADLEMWEPVAERLAPLHDVVRYDMLGHGASAKPPGPYRLDHFVDQLRRLADGLDLSKFVLAGFSMGGLVAQAFALAAPARIERLVLLNTVFDRSPPERAAAEARVREVLNGGHGAGIAAALERWFTPAFRAARPEVLGSIRRRMETNDLPAYAAAYGLFATADRALAERIGSIAVPTMVVTGAEDERSTAAMAMAMAARLPRGRCHIIPGQRHMTPLEVPDLVAALIAARARAGDSSIAAQ